MVSVAWVREFRYVFAACGPQEGTVDFRVAEAMNTENMNRFLLQVGEAHPHRQVLMILDGASSHRSKNLQVPDNVSLIPLPPYSPELNPVELLWHELREKQCANRVFDSLEAVCHEVEEGLLRFQSHPDAVSRLCGWPWIKDAINSIAT